MSRSHVFALGILIPVIDDIKRYVIRASAEACYLLDQELSLAVVRIFVKRVLYILNCSIFKGRIKKLK